MKTISFIVILISGLNVQAMEALSFVSDMGTIDRAVTSENPQEISLKIRADAEVRFGNGNSVTLGSIRNIKSGTSLTCKLVNNAGKNAKSLIGDSTTVLTGKELTTSTTLTVEPVGAGINHYIASYTAVIPLRDGTGPSPYSLTCTKYGQGDSAGKAYSIAESLNYREIKSALESTDDKKSEQILEMFNVGKPRPEEGDQKATTVDAAT